MTKMLIDRSTVEQALEALEMCRLNGSQYLYGNERDLVFSAIKDLRAALAEPVQEPEPAGWFEGPFGEFRANPLYRIAWPAQTVAWSIPLYLAPPQRKPLTDEEIAAEWRKASECAGKSKGAVTTSQFVQMFARAVEAKHGIKESP